MTEPKFTPGPWEAFFDNGKCGVTPSRGGKGDVANCQGFDGSRMPDEEAANAHLISAAPDLYAATERALEYAEDGAVPSIGLIAMLRTALAKARGEA